MDLIQINGRCFARGFESGQSGHDPTRPPLGCRDDGVAGPDFEAREIYEARRPEIAAALAITASQVILEEEGFV